MLPPFVTQDVSWVTPAFRFSNSSPAASQTETRGNIWASRRVLAVPTFQRECTIDPASVGLQFCPSQAPAPRLDGFKKKRPLGPFVRTVSPRSSLTGTASISRSALGTVTIEVPILTVDIVKSRLSDSTRRPRAEGPGGFTHRIDPYIVRLKAVCLPDDDTCHAPNYSLQAGNPIYIMTTV